MIKFEFSLLILLFFILFSCTPTKTIPPGPESRTESEEEPHIILDTEDISPETEVAVDESDRVYQASEERTWDLLHTMLDLSFDWNKSSVQGPATLTLSPLFYP